MPSKPDSNRRAFDHQHYVPCLRWKQGEYQALIRLREGTKSRITPLIELPERGWDFETQTEAKSLEQHLAPFAERVHRKWGDRPCFVDLRLLGDEVILADQTHAVDTVFSELRSQGCRAIPVTGPERDGQYQKTVRNAARRDGLGVCLRLGLAQAAESSVKQTVDELLRTVGAKPVETDLVLDLEAPNFVPLEGFSKLVQGVLLRILRLHEWRTLTLLGTSFPRTMAGLARGAQLVDRYEWRLYQRVAGSLLDEQCRAPTFGDYAIAHPEVLPVDMRIVKPTASLRYTVDDAWNIIKGQNVREHGYHQYAGMCQALLSSPEFAGRGFSSGDAYIADCADGLQGTGNLTTWRWVGTNHHIEKVVADVASLYGSSGTA